MHLFRTASIRVYGVINLNISVLSSVKDPFSLILKNKPNV